MKRTLWSRWWLDGLGVGCVGLVVWAAPSPFTVWPVDPLEKVFRDSKTPATAAQVLSIACARNEYESAQLAVTAAEDLREMTLEVSGLEGEGGARLPAECFGWHFVGFIPLTKNTPDTVAAELIRQAPFDAPDPLLEEQRVSLEAGQTLPVWITVHVPQDTPPALYRGRVTVKASRGNAELPIELRVFSFTVPDERHLLVTQWFNFPDVGRTHGVKPGSEEYWALLERYARNMAEHRQNVFNAPWDQIKVTRQADHRLSFDYSNFDRYVETFLRAGVKNRIEILHVGNAERGWGTPIVLSTVNATDAPTGKTVVLSPEEGLAPLLADLQKHLAARGWLEPAMIHVADEPALNNRDSWRHASQFVHRAAPGLRRIDAIEGTGFETDLEVLVPKLSHLRNWFDDFKRAQGSGRELWYYICCHPTGFYPNRFLDFSLTKVRLLHWLNWRFGVSGYLHWGLTYWGKEPFGTPSPDLPPGDTHVLYPGKTGPLSSIRWETERDSLEDYEYLWLLTERMKEAQKRLGPAAARFEPARRADEFACNLVRDFDDFTHDPAEFHRKRLELAQEITTALEPPLLMVETKPMDGAQLVPGPISVEVFGAVEKGATVKVNNRAVDVADDGSFACTESVGRGNTAITVETSRDGKKVAIRRFKLREE